MEMSKPCARKVNGGLDLWVLSGLAAAQAVRVWTLETEVGQGRGSDRT